MLHVDSEPKPPSEEVLILVMVESIIHAVEALSWTSDGKVKKLWKSPSMGSISTTTSTGSGGDIMNASSLKRVGRFIFN